MFSRTILADKHSESIATHQRIVRAARRQTLEYLPQRIYVPSAKHITHFEGKNGPDGLADKHSTGDYPEEYVEPHNNNGQLFTDIRNFSHKIRVAAKRRDYVSMAFNMAWLEHIVVDGMTPPHHRPYKEQVDRIDPREREEMNSRFKRIFTPGNNPLEMLMNNWKLVGPGGISTNHILFEAGIDFIMMPLSPKRLIGEISKEELKAVRSGKFLRLYDKSIHRIYKLEYFDRYEAAGWTSELAADVREVLLPECVKMVSLAWLAAIPRK